MNDFTKEELEHMANAICLMMAKCSMEKKWHGEVEKIGHKLQSMIDNYCEHKNDSKFNAIPLDSTLKMCKKCHGFWI